MPGIAPPGPATALQVQWIFAGWLASRSLAGIAWDLNVCGVPCPSAPAPVATGTAVATAGVCGPSGRPWPPPRYTGRQVWSRQHVEQFRGDDGGRVRVQQWNSTDEWGVLDRSAHASLVSEADFVAVQAVRSTRATGDARCRTHRLAGLLRCGIHGKGRQPGRSRTHRHPVPPRTLDGFLASTGFTFSPTGVTNPASP